MIEDRVAFAQNLTALKEQKGCSWLDIAQAIGHHRDRYVQKLATGEYQPRAHTARKIAAYFGVTAESMMEEGRYA